MDFYEEIEATINNEKDYSNIVPTAENIAYLIQYCEQVYNQFLKLVEEDELKNEKLKYDIQNYKFKKNYGEKFEVIIHGKNYNTVYCKNYSSYLELYKSGQLNNVNSLEILLELNYRTGPNSKLVLHENLFKIRFKPYEIIFMRKSNFKDYNMEQIEKNINEILNKFPKVNTIFCTK